MTRNKVYLGLLFIAGLLLGAGVLAFTNDLRTVDLHPTRHLLARDEVALSFALELAQMHERQLTLNGFTAPKLKEGEQVDSASYIERYHDELMATAYRMGNSFLRTKAGVQKGIQDDLRTAGYFDSVSSSSYFREVSDYLGDPHTYRDAEGTIGRSRFVLPTPTPLPSQ